MPLQIRSANNLRGEVAQCETGSSEVVQVASQAINKTLTDKGTTTSQSNILRCQNSCNNLRNLLLKMSEHG